MPLNLIAIEEHFWTPELRELRTAAINRSGAHLERLDDLGALRLREMDEAGIDMQVLSADRAGGAGVRARASRPPGTQHERPAARRRPRSSGPLRRLCRAADRRTRSRGRRARARGDQARLQGRDDQRAQPGGVFLDDKPFWPIFERAQALDVPIYLHPSTPHSAVIEAYYKDFAGLPGIRGAWASRSRPRRRRVRLVLERRVRRLSELKIILGHLGEGLPFLQWRIDRSLTRDAKLPRTFTDYMRQHFWITTSGAFSNAALTCSIEEMGIEKVIFSVDWPYVSNVKGREFLDAAPITDQQRRMIASENVRKLLKL